MLEHVLLEQKDKDIMDTDADKEPRKRNEEETRNQNRDVATEHSRNKLTLHIHYVRVHPVLQSAPLWTLDSIGPVLSLIELRLQQSHLLTTETRMSRNKNTESQQNGSILTWSCKLSLSSNSFFSRSSERDQNLSQDPVT